MSEVRWISCGSFLRWQEITNFGDIGGDNDFPLGGRLKDSALLFHSKVCVKRHWFNLRTRKLDGFQSHINLLYAGHEHQNGVLRSTSFGDDVLDHCSEKLRRTPVSHLLKAQFCLVPDNRFDWNE